ncbi:hypothetical protein MTO96_037167 [Rhipicephalus appendiculatus]
MELPSEGGPSAVIIDCPVTWNDRRKVITVRGQDKSDVIGALSKTDFRSALEGGRIENAYPSLDLKGKEPRNAV